MRHIFDVWMVDICSDSMNLFFLSLHVQLGGLVHKMDTLPVRSDINALYIRGLWTNTKGTSEEFLCL